jgi:hypothetical protein
VSDSLPVIIPRCACTVDVIVDSATQITVSDKPLPIWATTQNWRWEMRATDDYRMEVRLFLDAGDRLVVRPAIDDLPRYRSGGFGSMVQSEGGPWVHFDDLTALAKGGA